MASEPAEGLPDDLEAWVSERAAASDETRAEVMRRLLAAHRLLDEQPDRLDGAAPPTGDVASDVNDLRDRVDELAVRVGGVETDLDEKIADVRERVVQVKREADAKAPDDHDHPEVERRMDEGFENYEEVLEYLTDRADDLADAAADRDEKLQRIVTAVVELRRRVAAVERAIEDRTAVAELRRSANRQGISTASCASCGESVDLGLLDEPACPHCESQFNDVEAGGWFRPNRLTIGDRPALESGGHDAPDAELDGDADAVPDPRRGSGEAPSTDDGEEFTFGGEVADDADDPTTRGDRR